MSLIDRETKLASSIKVVLMRTTHPGNIGAVARAMKNMGLNQLALVNPSDCTNHGEPSNPVQSMEAVRRSSGAKDLLQQAHVYESLEESLAECHIVIGASARSRKMVWPLMNPRDCAELIHKEIFNSPVSKSIKIALMFGQEASGLTNDELQRCHYHVNIPAIADFSSLNLAMAVQLICYEIRMAMLLDTTVDQPHQLTSAILSAKDEGWDEELATASNLESFFIHLEETLINIEFHDAKNPRRLMNRLRRLFQRAHMDKMEVNILRGILTAVQKQLK